jgi:hypothetical protein
VAPSLIGMDPIIEDPFRYKLGGRVLNAEIEEFTDRYGSPEAGHCVTTRDQATYSIIEDARRGSPAGGAYLNFCMSRRSLAHNLRAGHRPAGRQWDRLDQDADRGLPNCALPFGRHSGWHGHGDRCCGIVCRRARLSRTALSGNWCGLLAATLDRWNLSVAADKDKATTFIEILNGKFRTECLNASWWLSLDEARQKFEARRRYDNEQRPHRAIGNEVHAALYRVTCNRGRWPPDEAEIFQPQVGGGNIINIKGIGLFEANRAFLPAAYRPVDPREGECI